MMNIYRLFANNCHVAAILVFLFKFWKTRSSEGISGKTQILYALTYTFRYLDVFTNFISYYNTSLKIFFVLASYFIVFATFSLFVSTSRQEYDTFRIERLIIPVTVLMFLLNHNADNRLTQENILELGWTWSIYMEAVALIPQLFMIWKMRKVDGYVGIYIVLMAAYRGLYIVNWVYRYHYESYYDQIAIIGGVVESTVGISGVLFFCLIKFGIIGKQSSNQKIQPSIYLLPSVYEQLGHDILNHDEKNSKSKDVLKQESPPSLNQSQH